MGPPADQSDLYYNDVTLGKVHVILLIFILSIA